VRNFWSEVVLYEWDEMEIVLAQHDRARFRSIHDLANDVELHGYYGAFGLSKPRSNASWTIVKRRD
jgi:glucuronokinase